MRIIFLVPCYAMASWPSLVAPRSAVYLAAIRDIYEALVIYNFMSLCLAYVGGPGAVETKMAGYILRPRWRAGTCCLPPIPVNGRFVRWTKQGALQFVIIKPILAVLVVALHATGHYTEGDWSFTDAYVYITIVYNITYTVALYALLLFYLGTHELLVPFRPLLKFVLIKAVIFLSYWQGFLIAICSAAGLVKSAEEGVNIQNFLLCIEMLPAAICMWFAFPHTPYRSQAGGGLSASGVTHAISIRDMVTDTVHQFAPTYHDYVLYSDGSSRPAAGARGASKKPGDAAALPAIAEGDVELGAAAAWNQGAEPALRPAVSDDRLDLAGNRDFDSPPTIGKSKYLEQERENPFALDSDEEGAATRAPPTVDWDAVTLDSPRRGKR